MTTILLDVDRWDRASDAAQDAAIVEVGRWIAPAFAHVRTERFTGQQRRVRRESCRDCDGMGGRSAQSGSDYPDCATCNNDHYIEHESHSEPVSHRVAMFRHAATGIEFVLVPGRMEIAAFLISRAPFASTNPDGLRDTTSTERQHVVRAGMFDPAFDQGTWSEHPLGLVDAGLIERIAYSIRGLERAQADAFHTLVDEVGSVDKYMPPGCVGRTGYGSSTTPGNPVTLAFSPDGRWLATGSSDHDVRISDAATGRQLSHRAAIPSQTSIAFSPDGLRVAIASTSTIALIEVATGERITKLATGLPANRMAGRTRQFRAAAWCADGRLLIAEATSNKGNTAYLGLVDPETTEIVRSTEWAFRKSVHVSFATSLDGTRAAIALYDGTVAVWDVPRWEVVRELAIKPRMIAIGGDRLFTVFDDVHAFSLADGTRSARLGRPTLPVIAVSSDGARVAWWERDSGVKVHDMATATARSLGYGTTLPIAFSPDGTRLATGIRGHAFVAWWNV